ncbi:RnfABCDGE type electron transport complex subunit G [Candidatus Omnitrophota bacterium]
MNNILRFTLVLFLVNLIAASILAGVYYITKPKIDREQRLVEQRSLREVMPEAVGDRLEAVKEDGEVKYWKVFKGPDHRAQGYIFIAKKYGYSDDIETMVGMKTNGAITGVRILSQNETPGLGAKIAESVSGKTISKAIAQLFSRQKKVEKKIFPYFTEQLKGLNVRKAYLSNNKIQAITGATISSQAVVDSIRIEGLEILNAK